MSGDFDFEPIRGLPGYLPPGERLLWQGEPDLRAIALRVFHVRKVAIYFAALAAWRIGDGLADGLALQAAVASALTVIGLGAIAVAILMVLALLTCRTTVYSITSRRVVMRIGVALPITFNLPFAVIGAGALKLNRDGTGTIPLTLLGANKIAYPILWPHARPWRLARAEPALRLVPNATAVAKILVGAVSSALPDAIETGHPLPAERDTAKASVRPLSPVTA